MREFFDPTQNPVGFAIPFFLLTIALELGALKWLDHDDNVTGYAFKDARTSIFMGLGSLVTTTLFKLAFFWIFVLIYEHVAPVQLPNTWWAFLVTVLAVDFAYYWQHRFVHRVRVGWAAHQAHHSSEFMNFGTALRQKWNPWFDVLFLLPIPLLGMSNPEGVAVLEGGNVAVTDERKNSLTIFHVDPQTRELSTEKLSSFDLGERGKKNKGIEGIAWDPRQHRLLLGQERDPLTLFSLASDGSASLSGALQALPSDQFTCLPEPLMPAKGFSCVRHDMPYFSATRRSVIMISCW